MASEAACGLCLSAIVANVYQCLCESSMCGPTAAQRCAFGARSAPRTPRRQEGLVLLAPPSISTLKQHPSLIHQGRGMLPDREVAPLGREGDVLMIKHNSHIDGRSSAKPCERVPSFPLPPTPVARPDFTECGVVLGEQSPAFVRRPPTWPLFSTARAGRPGSYGRMCEAG